MKSKISIITICYNAEDCIEGAIQSALSQTYDNIEYIVVEGQSTDGTAAIVEKYRDDISQIISIKNAGIYGNMNEGIRAATGDIVYFLNADDRLFDNDVVQKIVKEFEKDKEAKVVYGKAFPTNLPQKRLYRYYEPFVGKIERKQDLFLKCFNHQRAFVKRELFVSNGLFNTEYKICADTSWFVKYYYSGGEMKFLDEYVVYYNVQGRSYKQRWVFIAEKLSFVFKQASFIDFFIFFWVATIRNLKKDDAKKKFEWDQQ